MTTTLSFLRCYVQKSKREIYHNCVYSGYFKFSSVLLCLTWLNLDFWILWSVIRIWNPIGRNLLWKVSDEGKGLHKISLMSPPFEFKERGFHSHWLEPDVGRRTPKVRMGEIPVNGFRLFTGFMHLLSRSRLQGYYFSALNKIKYHSFI